MRREVTQKQKDQWQATREKGVKKYQARIKAKVLVPIKKKSPVLKSKPKKVYKIKKVSKIQAKRLSRYHKQRKEWFKNTANQYCKLNMTDDCTKDHPKIATDVHHSAGKVGNLLFAEEFWLPGDRECHRLAHDNDKRAKEKGASVLRLSK